MHYGWGSYVLWVGLICIMGGAICIMGGAHMHYGWSSCVMGGAHALSKFMNT